MNGFISTKNLAGVLFLRGMDVKTYSSKSK